LKSSKKIQTQIMGTVFGALFLFSIVLLLVYEYELYNTSLKSARSLVQLVDSLYLTRISRQMEKSRSGSEFFQEFVSSSAKISFEKNSRSELGKIARNLSLSELTIQLDEKWYSSSKSPSLTRMDLQSFIGEPQQYSAYYDKGRETFIIHYPVFDKASTLRGHALGLVSMGPIKSGLAEYRHILMENGFEDASVFLKSADFFMGENLKFGHHYLLRNRAQDLLFEPTDSGFLTMHPFSLPGGVTGYLGCIIPEDEVLQEVYRLGYLSALTVFGLFCVLTLFTYFNLRRILYPLQQAMSKVEDSSKNIGRIASQSSHVSEDLIQAVEEQGSTIEKTSLLMQEVTVLSNSTYQQSTQMREKMGLTESLVGEGSRRMESLTDNMQSLNEFANDMRGIVNLIKEIANRIDIVAINAGIEAARAGDKGRDFAVVADEIARLANNSLEHSLNIEKQIGQSLKLIQNGIMASKDTQAMLQRLSEQVSQTFGSVEEIGVNVQQQTDSIMDLNKALLTIERHNKKNRLGVDFTAEQGRQLSQAVRTLQEVELMIYRLVGELNRSHETSIKEEKEREIHPE